MSNSKLTKYVSLTFTKKKKIRETNLATIVGSLISSFWSFCKLYCDNFLPLSSLVVQKSGVKVKNEHHTKNISHSFDIWRHHNSKKKKKIRTLTNDIIFPKTYFYIFFTWVESFKFHIFFFCMEPLWLWNIVVEKFTD